MDEKLKSIFWDEQNYLRTRRENKYSLTFKGFVMTMIPTFVTYYNFYESRIRRNSFLLQFIIIYSLYKLSIYSLVSYEIGKKIEGEIKTSEKYNYNII